MYGLVYDFFIVYDLSPMMARVDVAHTALQLRQQGVPVEPWMFAALRRLGVPDDDLWRRAYLWLAFVEGGPYRPTLFQGEDGEMHSFLENPSGGYWQLMLTHRAMVAERLGAEREMARTNGFAFWPYL